MMAISRNADTAPGAEYGQGSVSPGRRFLTDMIIINLGILCMSAGVYFFKMTNGFSTGGVSGLSIIIAKVSNYAVSAPSVMLIINIILLIAGFIFLGRGVGIKTVYCSLMFSLETWLFELIVPLSAPLTDDALLELAYAILLTGVGSSLLFSRSASSGGTDITAMILKKYTSINLGVALLANDFIIAMMSFFTYGIKIGLYSMLGLFIKAFLIDSIIESINLNKSFTIVTEKPAEVCSYILNVMHNGVTTLEATGAYTNMPKKMILTSCRRAQAAKLEKALREIDPDAFITITNSNKIIGRGFRGV